MIIFVCVITSRPYTSHAWGGDLWRCRFCARQCFTNLISGSPLSRCSPSGERLDFLIFLKVMKMPWKPKTNRKYGWEYLLRNWHRTVHLKPPKCRPEARQIAETKSVQMVDSSRQAVVWYVQYIRYQFDLRFQCTSTVGGGLSWVSVCKILQGQSCSVLPKWWIGSYWGHVISPAHCSTFPLSLLFATASSRFLSHFLCTSLPQKQGGRPRFNATLADSQYECDLEVHHHWVQLKTWGNHAAALQMQCKSKFTSLCFQKSAWLQIWLLASQG